MFLGKYAEVILIWLEQKKDKYLKGFPPGYFCPPDAV